MERPTRRDLLRATPVALGALAGCEGLTGQGTPPTVPDGSTVTTTTPPPTRSLDLRNESENQRYVSVVIREGSEVRSSTTVETPAESSRTFSIAAEPGTLTVELETTDGLTASHPWVVGNRMSDLVVTLTDTDVEFSQTAWCTPECSPISKNGTAAEFPYYGGPVFMSYYGANVVLVNTTDETIEVDLTLRHEGDSILDYRYVVPADVTIEFPGVHSAGGYTIHVESDFGSLDYEWRPPKERRLQLRLTETGVHATCGQTTASFILANDDDSPHQIEITAYRPESDLAEFRIADVIQPGAHYRKRGVYTGSGQYELRVETASGASTIYDWWLCPPRGPTEITIQSDGEIHVVQYQPGE